MTTSAPTAALPSTLKLGWACTRIELKQFFRQREMMMFSFAFPILMLIIFGAVFGTTTTSDGVSIRAYFTAGMIATGVMLTSFQTLAIWLAMERDEGTLKRLHGTPLPPLAFFLGKIGMVLLTSLIQTAILLVVARIFYKISPPVGWEMWLRFGWVFVLGVSAGTILGIAASGLARTGRSAPAVISPIAIALQFVSGVYFVLGSLPQWMQTLGALFPLKWLAQGMRAALLRPEFALVEPAGSWELVRIALVLLVWIIVGLIVCLKTFRWLGAHER